jgi:hypothetical protein
VLILGILRTSPDCYLYSILHTPYLQYVLRGVVVYVYNVGGQRWWILERMHGRCARRPLVYLIFLMLQRSRACNAIQFPSPVPADKVTRSGQVRTQRLSYDKQCSVEDSASPASSVFYFTLFFSLCHSVTRTKSGSTIVCFVYFACITFANKLLAQTGKSKSKR